MKRTQSTVLLELAAMCHISTGKCAVTAALCPHASSLYQHPCMTNTLTSQHWHGNAVTVIYRQHSCFHQFILHVVTVRMNAQTPELVGHVESEGQWASQIYPEVKLTSWIPWSLKSANKISLTERPNFFPCLKTRSCRHQSFPFLPCTKGNAKKQICTCDFGSLPCQQQGKRWGQRDYPNCGILACLLLIGNFVLPVTRVY